MNKKDIQHFTERLIEERVKLLKELGYFEDKIFNNSQRDAAGDLSAYSVHMADQASDAQEREKAYQMASAEGRLLYHIDEAIARIREGTYGVCCACGKKIKASPSTIWKKLWQDIFASARVKKADDEKRKISFPEKYVCKKCQRTSTTRWYLCKPQSQGD